MEGDGVIHLEVAHDMIEGALRALDKAIAIQMKKKKETDLLVDDNGMPISLLVTLAMPLSKHKSKPFRINIPCPFYDRQKVCLIVKDEKYESFKEILEQQQISAIVKMMPFGKLKKMKEDQRWKSDFFRPYDLTIVDEKVANMIPSVLGCDSLDTKNVPVRVLLGNETFVHNVQRALRCTYLRLPRGKDLRIIVGDTSMKVEQLGQNVKRVLGYLDEFFMVPGRKYSNKIQCVAIDSCAVRGILPRIPIFIHPDDKRLFLEGDFGVTGGNNINNNNKTPVGDTIKETKAVGDTIKETKAQSMGRKSTGNIKRKETVRAAVGVSVGDQQQKKKKRKISEGN